MVQLIKRECTKNTTSLICMLCRGEGMVAVGEVIGRLSYFGEETIRFLIFLERVA